MTDVWVRVCILHEPSTDGDLSMNPRYQVFISSTFRDLRAERQAVLEAILELGHFPSGMEVFPAASATPWSLIETIIKECDYYVLIIGGMYGSTDASGVSYTEREYDLAVASGLPVLAFLHKNPMAIPAGLSELTPESRVRLAEFRKKVETHHCKFWENPHELKADVVVGLTHAMRVNPRVGWVKFDRLDSPETLKKLTLAMEENNRLEGQVTELRESLGAILAGQDGVASGDDPITLRLDRQVDGAKELQTTWDEILVALGPNLLSDCRESFLYSRLNDFVFEKIKRKKPISFSLPQIIPQIERGEEGVTIQFGERVQVEREDSQKVFYQFMALGYIEPAPITSYSTDVMGHARSYQHRGFRFTKEGARAFALKQSFKKDTSKQI